MQMRRRVVLQDWLIGTASMLTAEHSSCAGLDLDCVLVMFVFAHILLVPILGMLFAVMMGVSIIVLTLRITRMRLSVWMSFRAVPGSVLRGMVLV